MSKQIITTTNKSISTITYLSNFFASVSVDAGASLDASASLDAGARHGTDDDIGTCAFAFLSNSKI
jgi:hypothetical protein